MAIGYNADNTNMYGEDDRFGYGLREQADIKANYEKALLMLKRSNNILQGRKMATKSFKETLSNFLKDK